MEPIIDYLKRKLQEAGAGSWEAIANECSVAKTLPRKIAYSDRENPGVQTIQPLLDFFQAVDRGDKRIPESCSQAFTTASFCATSNPNKQAATETVAVQGV